jgi:hypothetical protein
MPAQVIPVPGRGETVGNPTLDAIRDFIAGVWRRTAANAWASVAPGEPIVRKAFSHDPEQYSFIEKDLPGLYVFPQGSTKPPEQIAEDIRVEYGNIRVFWVLPFVGQERQVQRRPIFWALQNVLDQALREERDPGWIVEGDTDPLAATEGSWLLDAAGLKAISIADWADTTIAIGIGTEEGATKRTFPALSIRLVFERVVERSVEGIASDADLDLKVTVDGFLASHHIDVFQFAMIYVQDGAVAQTIGTAATKLTGFAANGLSRGIVADHVNDRLRVVEGKTHRVQGSFSLSGTTGRIVQLRLRKNGVEVPGIGGRATMTGGAVAIGFAGPIDCAANDELTVYAEADVDSTSITLIDGALLSDNMS